MSSAPEGAQGPRPHRAPRLAARLSIAARRLGLLVLFITVLDAASRAASGTSLAGTGLGWLASVGLGAMCLGVPWLLLTAIDTRSQRGLFTLARELLSPRDEAAAYLRVGAILSGLVSAGVALGAAFLLTREVVIDMAQPHFAALTIVGLNGALWIAAFALFMRLWPVGHAFVRRLAPSPVGYVLRTPGRLLSALALVGVTLTLLVCVVFWSTLSYLPWKAIGSIAGGILLTVAVELPLRRMSPVLSRVANLVVLTLCCAGVVAMFALRPENGRERRALRESLLGGWGRSAALALFDFDEDGYLNMFGDGDCAPFDAQIHPGAIDIADNGRDEDCDGVDLSRSLIARRPRQNWPVPAEFPRRPPIILITIDTFAARHMHALGGSRDITPALDAFAEKGTLFSACFAEGPSTRLSFPSIFTSRYDTQIKRTLIGKHPYPLESSELLLAEVLRNHGYDTTAVVPGNVFSATRWSTLLQGFSHILDATTVKGRGKDHTGSLITDTAIEALKRDTRGKPLFLWAHYYDAHSPHNQPADVPSFGTSAPDVYDAELALVDRDIGHLLSAIDATFHEQALVIITADHGVAFDAPRHSKHGYGYDLATNVLHVPLIVRGPGVRAQVLGHPVSTMDIAPTIANLLHLPGRLPFEGASLVPELFTGERTRPPRLHHQFFLLERRWKGEDPLALSSLRTDQYDLVYDHRSGLYELYDYNEDYEEQRDLSETPEHAEAFKALKRQLQMLLYEVYAPTEQGEPKAAEDPKHGP